MGDRSGKIGYLLAFAGIPFAIILAVLFGSEAAPPWIADYLGLILFVSGILFLIFFGWALVVFAGELRHSSIAGKWRAWRRKRREKSETQECRLAYSAHLEAWERFYEAWSSAIASYYDGKAGRKARDEALSAFVPGLERAKDLANHLPDSNESLEHWPIKARRKHIAAMFDSLESLSEQTASPWDGEYETGLYQAQQNVFNTQRRQIRALYKRCGLIPP